jgi:hypothetical protein
MTHFLVHFLAGFVFFFLIESRSANKRLRSTFHLRKTTPPLVSTPRISTSRPNCHSCLFFQPHFENGETVHALGKCTLFGEMGVFEYATHSRANTFQCGPNGQLYQKEPTLFFQ